MGKLLSLLRKTFIGRWIDAYKAYIEKISTSGYVGQPSVFLWTICRAVFFFWSLIQVGRIRIKNKHYLKSGGRLIFCPNHSSLLDAIVTLPALPRPVRGIGAFETFRWCWGLVGIVLSKLGAIPVDRANGKSVLKPAIKVVGDGASMVIFPEGKISASGELLPFKPGPALIANAVFDLLGGRESVTILPIHICYHKRETASAVNFWKMGFKWRGGVTITICPPIRIADLLNRDADHIMQLVRDAITSVDCRSCCG
jgi:1-acyl-sn-glycerol-3-phosphate acyltransferase